MSGKQTYEEMECDGKFIGELKYKIRMERYFPDRFLHQFSRTLI
jgi:hypothetical protein